MSLWLAECGRSCGRPMQACLQARRRLERRQLRAPGRLAHRLRAVAVQQAEGRRHGGAWGRRRAPLQPGLTATAAGSAAARVAAAGAGAAAPARQALPGCCLHVWAHGEVLGLQLLRLLAITRQVYWHGAGRSRIAARCGGVGRRRLRCRHGPPLRSARPGSSGSSVVSCSRGVRAWLSASAGRV